MEKNVSPVQLRSLLAVTIANRLPVLITGAPGCGKSDVVGQAADDASNDIILSHPGVADPTDAKGLPWPNKDGESATFLPFGELARAMRADKPTVWFLDDLGQATPAVQASFMQLLLARRVNGHALPDHVTFIAATNRRTDRAGVSGILEPVKSRFVTIVNLEPTIDDWKLWAYSNNIPEEVISFLNFRPQLLNNFEPTGDMTNSPSPRTWSHVAKLVRAKLPDNVARAAYAGAVGPAAAGEFIAFLEVYRNLPDPDLVIAEPDKAPIPSDPSTLWALVTAMAYRAKPSNFGGVVRYGERLMNSQKGEHGSLLILDCCKRDSQLMSTAEFSQLATSKLGKLMLGA